MRVLIAFTLLFATQATFADNNATRMVCEGQGLSSFILYLDPTTENTQVMSLFDGSSLWLARSIQKNDNHFTAEVFRPESAASGMVDADEIKSISFSLPARRTVRRVQTGGYYVPEYTTYPAKFFLKITKHGPNEKTSVLDVTCIGY